MLLASLLLVVGTAWADAPTPGQRYRLKNVMTGLYMQANGSSNLQLQAGKWSLDQFFRVETADNGQFYLKSETGANKYVNASGWNAVVGSGDSKTPYTIALVNGETDVYTLAQTASSYKGMIGADANTAGSSLYCNKVASENGKWQFEPVATPQVCTFDPAKTYRIKSEYSGLYMELVNYTQASGEGAFQLKNMSANDGQKFTFEAASDGKYYLKTVKDETTFYVNQNSWNFIAGATATTPFTIAVVDGHTAIYSIHQALNAGYAGNVNTATDGTYIFCNQPNLTGNTIWSFEEVADVIVDVTYIYKYGETELKRETVPSIVGSPYAFNLPFGFTTETAGSVTASGEVIVECSENLPFEYAATPSEITKWYYMQMHSNNKKYIKRDDKSLSWNDIQVDEANIYDYAWGFVGDPINGFKVVNYALGKDYALLSSGKNADAVTLTEYANATPLFAMHSSENVDHTTHFCLKPATGNYLNAQGTTVKHWGASDAGSTIVLRELPAFRPVDGQLYAFKSPSGTYLNLTQKGDTYASFQSAPSYFYIGTSGESFYFESKNNQGQYLNAGGDGNNTWGASVKNNQYLWSIFNKDTEGYVSISRVGSPNNGLGSTSNTDVNTGIYTNAGSEQGTCNKWQIVKAYPLTIVYEFKGNELSTETIYVIDGQKYTITNKDEYTDKVITSCTATNGVSPQKINGVWSASITAATTITVVLGDKATLEKDKAYILKVKDQNLYLDIRTLGIHDETVSGTNNISLGARPYPIYFEEGANGTWKMKNVNGKYVGLYPQKAWDPVINTTAHNWTIALENGVVTIAREAGKFVNANSVAAGKPLYCDKATALQFELIDYDDVDFITGAGLGKEGAEGPYVAIKEIDADGTTTSLPVGMGWILTVEVENPNGASHGQWGSSILATGKEPFPYKNKHNGFQLYLQSGTNGAKKLDVVFGNADHIVNNVDYKGDFKAVITYDGAGNLKVVTTNAEGTTATDTYTVTLPEITEFAYGLPKDINIKRLSIEKIDPEYTFTIGNTPNGVTVQYNGQDITSGTKLNESKLNVDLFTATDVSGYTWEIVVDKERHTLTLVYTAAQKVENPEAVVALVKRIGGNSAADKFKFVLDPSINSKQETFVLGNEDGKILIKGSTLSAITTGIGWYLNNIAHINIAWNSLNEKTVSGDAYADLSNLPLPSQTETHTSDAKYRYYLNTCTFGYSMTSWTWTRWQQEIDWMALHGINMPLQLVGLEEVWRTFLIKQGYSETDAKAFVAGPAFIAWWAMNNLQGWGGTAPGSKSGYNNLAGAGGVQDDAWYVRQKNLAKQIVEAQRALGMEPVIPGWSGMVPTNFNEKTGYATRGNGGNWAGDFVRPLLLNTSVGASKYAEIAADYYKCLHAVMGESQYYSMDPFHEGGGAGTMKDYEYMYAAMEAAKPGSQWVIQQWQWSATQKYSLSAVPAGRLIVLDLFSDGSPAFDSYNGYAPQDAVFCAIPNFGGRSGLMGRLQNVTDNYFKFKGKYASIKGIGTAPEAIEQTPVTYDLIYQLPWMNGKKPNVAEWVDNYAIARYGKDNAVVKEAWSKLRQGPLNYGADGIQGPVEDVWAARPNLNANNASYWGATISKNWNGTLVAGNTYTVARRQMLIDAVYKLIDQKNTLKLKAGSIYESNYLYDIVEFGGGVMADYAHDLLLGIGEAKTAAGADFANNALYKARRDAYLQLIRDMDEFRGTNLNFRLGKWTQEARSAAGEITNAKTATADWYEYNNARTILTTWSSPGTNLTDYSYRSWQGLLKDYYLPRWEYYFKEIEAGRTPTDDNYKFFEWNWAHGKEHYVGQTSISNNSLTEGQQGHTKSYTREPIGNTVTIAKEMLSKYIIPIKYNDGTTYYAYRTFNTDLTGKVTITVAAGATVDFTQYFDVPTEATVKGNFVNNSNKAAPITAVPIANTSGAYTGTITLTDGTKLENFSVVLKANLLNGVYNIKLVTDWGNTPVFIKSHRVETKNETTGYTAVTEGYMLVATSDGLSTNDELDKWFTITPAGNGYTISAQGHYLKSHNVWEYVLFSDDAKEAGTYLFDDSNTHDIYKIVATDGSHLQAWSYVMADVPGDAEASTFTIEKMTSYPVAMSNEGYATIYLPFNIILPDGVHAYDICSDELEGNNLNGVLSVIAGPGEILKAGTPAILEGASGTVSQLTITMSNTGAKTNLPNSVLHGSFTRQTLQPIDNSKTFILNGEIFETITDSREIPANSCWVVAATTKEEIDLNSEYVEIKADKENKPTWKFKAKNTGKGITITKCLEASSGHLVIGSKYTVAGVEKEVIAISDDFLHDNLNLTEVTLPATLTSIGTSYTNYMFDITYQGADEGAGENIGVPTDGKDEETAKADAERWTGAIHDCRYKVLGTSTWRMTVDVKLSVDNLEHFNEYGSCLFATKEKTLSNNYNDGSMQLYLRADKGIVLKLDQTGDTYMFNKPDNGTQYTGNTFTFILENDGAGGYMAQMVYGDGTVETFEITAADHAELHDFNTIWSSLGEGITVNVRFDKLTNKGLFVGCKNLKAIHVAEGNPSFSGCDHGVLYNKAMTHIIRFPEGGGEVIEDCGYTENGHRHFETPRTVTKVYAGALHGVNAHIIFHSNPSIMFVEGHEEHMIAKYHLVIDDDAEVIDFNSNNRNKFETVNYNRTFSAPSTYGTIMLPFVPDEESLSKITFFEFESGDANKLTFKEVTAVKPNTPYLFTMKEDGIKTLEGGVTTITTVTNYTSENTNGNWTSVGCYSSGTVITEGETNSYYGLNNDKEFVRVKKKINTKPYRAYYKMASSANGEAPAAKFSLIFRDGSTQVITPSQIEGWEENVYYDLMGRRVMNPTNGVYIVNGKKVVVK